MHSAAARVLFDGELLLAILAAGPLADAKDLARVACACRFFAGVVRSEDTALWRPVWLRECARREVNEDDHLDASLPLVSGMGYRAGLRHLGVLTVTELAHDTTTKYFRAGLSFALQLQQRRKEERHAYDQAVAVEAARLREWGQRVYAAAEEAEAEEEAGGAAPPPALEAARLEEEERLDAATEAFYEVRPRCAASLPKTRQPGSAALVGARPRASASPALLRLSHATALRPRAAPARHAPPGAPGVRGAPVSHGGGRRQPALSARRLPRR
jgi:hypothetical protein